MQILCKCVYECVMHLSTTISLFTLALLALLRRCYQCRSRGELGSCKDPFSFNATDVEMEPGVSAIPCASGWCGKVIEGGGTYALDGKKLRWLIYAYPYPSFSLSSSRLRSRSTAYVRAAWTRWQHGSMRRHDIQPQEGVHVLLPGRLVQCCRWAPQTHPGAPCGFSDVYIPS